MPTQNLNLEIVTPLFLRGSDNTRLDLRPPPFKALFRYWWRATVGETNADHLRSREGDLFGNTKKRSPLSIRIPVHPILPSDLRHPLPHSQTFDAQAYLPGGRFNLTLTAPNLGDYTNIAEIGFLLGGVGNRSRRGFGSIRYQNWQFQTVQDLQDKVYQTLDAIAPGRITMGADSIQVNHPHGLPDYPVIRTIYFSQASCGNVDNLLSRIGQATHDHCDAALGSAAPRMASPIHVRVHKIGNEFVPVVTQLNSVFPGGAPHGYEQTQEDFITAILT